MTTKLRARLVVPVDRPPLEGGLVTIDGERIVAVESATVASGPWRDLGDVALVPGFVNAHTHLEFSHLREPLGRPGMRLVDWLPLAIAERHNRSRTAEAIALGVQESLLAGTVAIGEIATAAAADYAATDCEVALVQFLEVIGFSCARADSAFAAVEARIAAATKRGRKSFSAGAAESTPVPCHLGLSPHAPYTVSPALVARLVDRARAINVPVAMHLAESAEELRLLTEGRGPFRELLEAHSMWDDQAIPAGSSPHDYLRLLARAPRALVIHGNYLTRDEQEFLSAHADRLTLVYCPRTHAYFDHPTYPLAELLAAGVHVALGTDSRASNPDLGMLGEIRHVARTQPGVSGERLLRLATLDGAQALGCDHECGSITPGKLAHFVAVPLAGRSLDEALAECRRPSAVWFRGREV